MNIDEKVMEILNNVINPVLEKDNGSVSYVGTRNNIVIINFEGQCANCPSSQFTLDNIIKKEIIKAIPQIKDVIIDPTNDEEFYKIALKLLKKQ